MTDARLFCLALSLAVLSSLFAVPAYAASDVWDDNTRDSVTTDGYTVTGQGSSAFSQKARSINTWNPATGGVEFEYTLSNLEHNHTPAAGLGKDPFAHSNERSAIEYAMIRHSSTGFIRIFESGTERFTSSSAAANDSVFKITMDSDGTVRYYINDILLYTSTVVASGDYYLHFASKGSPSMTVLDSTPPTVTAPADVTADATGTFTTVALGTATATDVLDSNPTITNDAPVSFRTGATTVTWTATDTGGNAATATQRVTVRDPTPPLQISAPSSLTVEATGLLTAVDIGTPTVQNAGPNAVITNNAPELFPIGYVVVTWTVTDSGNTANAYQVITVRDTTPPVVTAPADITAEATGSLTTLDIGTPTVTDADPNPTITHDAPESFPPGETAVTWTATDSGGRTTTATQTVTVRDTTPPVVTAPADITAEATGSLTTLDIGTPTVTDADPNPTITHDAPESFPPGETAVTWTATDSGGRTTTATQTVTVRDTTPPVVTPPPDITAEATGALTTLDVGAATATDVLDSNPTITNDAPESFPPGETAVTWTATDSSDNKATATQIVTVQYTYSEGLWYDHAREAGNQTDTVTLQAHRSGDFFSLRCLFFGQNASVWHNQSTVYYETEHSTTGTVHVRCYEKSNDIPAFQVTSYAPYKPGSGFNTINEVFGSDGLFGVPIPFIFVLLMASMWTGRSAQVGIIVTAATIGIMTALGLFELQPEAWALIVLLTAAGVLLGKKAVLSSFILTAHTYHMRQESHFSLTKHFPVLELMFSSAPIAFIITRTGQLKIYKLKPILNQYFVCEYGWFRLRPERKLGIFKQVVYLYSGANFSPLDGQALKEIELHCKRMGKTELEKYIEEKMEEQEAHDLRAMHADHEHEVNTEKIGEFTPDEEAGEPEPEEPEEEYRAKIRLVARAAREPVNHYVETFLASYCAVDPQALRTAFKEVQSTEKHIKSMSRTLSTYFPIMIVFVAIFGAFLFLTNIEVIASQFEGIFEP